MCLKQKWERNASVSHTCIHPDARCDSACEGSEVVTLLSDSETRHYENYFYRLASHEKLISNIRVAPRLPGSGLIGSSLESNTNISLQLFL